MNQDLYLHGLIGGAPAVEPAWTRPADWLVVPDLGPTDDKIYLLNHIRPSTANYIAFVCTGNYTVDWGDGNIENVASGVNAQHQYDFDSIVSDLTLQGFKQCLITITPNGGNILTANFNKLHSSVDSVYAPSYFVEFKMNCPNMTDLGLNNFWLSTINFYSVERIVIGQHDFNNTTGSVNGNPAGSVEGMFAYLYGLKEIDINGLFDQILDGNEFFSESSNLLNITFATESLDWSSCTNFSYFFYNCKNITSVPALITTGGTNFAGFVNNCYSLTEFPLIDTSNGLDFSYTFDSCFSLVEVPLLDLSSATSMRYTFRNTHSLKELPNFNTTNVTNMLTVLQHSRTLNVLPAWSLISISSAGNMPIFEIHQFASVNFTNISQNFNISYGLLDRDNLINLFNNLASVVGKTLTITANVGTSDLTAPDLAIATGKGWTVTT